MLVWWDDDRKGWGVYNYRHGFDATMGIYDAIFRILGNAAVTAPVGPPDPNVEPSVTTLALVDNKADDHSYAYQDGLPRHIRLLVSDDHRALAIPLMS